MKVYLIAIVTIALSACHAAPPPQSAPSYQEQIVISSAPHPETHAAAIRKRRELSLRDRALIEAAERSMDRVRKRLDWLNGRDPKE